MKNLYFPLYTFILIFLCLNTAVNAQSPGGVGINTGGLPPDNSAVLDASDTGRGELMPRMSTAQRNAIVSPATGLTIFNTDCNVYNYNSGTPVNPDWSTVNASNALIAGVSIFANPAGSICGGTGVSFTAIPAEGINSPGYQWKVNGQNVGGDSSFYTSSGFNNGDVVTCILSSNQACLIGSPATSNAVVMSVVTIPGTPGSITGNTSLCPDSSGNVYSINPVAEASYYTWTVPGGATVTAGAGTNSITVTFGTASGNISVEAANGCGASAASSLGVTVNPPIPSTPGAITGSNEVGMNTAGVLYYISRVNNASTYTWTVPAGSSITSGQGTDSIMVTFGTDSGAVSVTAGNACGASAASSLAVAVVNCNGYGNGSQTFNYTGGIQYFTVPLCIFSLTVTATGAAGANATEPGGAGGYASGTLAVTPGEILYVYVGGQSGWNGGGIPGSQGGGYGGDGSDIRVGGTAITDRVFVAGGGGGGAGDNSSYGAGPGGAGGGLTGNMGGNSAGCGGCDYGGGGGGGTQNAGGAMGYGDCMTCGGGCGGAGSLFSGGAGVNQDHPVGGGGGGGYYGGGGGGSYCSCGGGSSYIGGVTNGVTTTGGGPTSGDGQIVIAW